MKPSTALILLSHAFQVLILFPADLLLPSLCPTLSLPCTQLPVQTSKDCEGVVAGAEAVVDLWLAPGLSERLGYLAETENFIHISLGRGHLPGIATYPLYPAGEFALLQDLLIHYNWTKATVLGSAQPHSLTSTFAYLNLQGISITTLILPSSDPSIVQTTLAMSVKSTGANVIVLNTAAAETAVVLKAAESVKMMKRGYAYILTFQAWPIVGGQGKVGNGLIWAGPFCEDLREISQFTVLEFTLKTVLLGVKSLDELRTALIEREKNPRYCLYNTHKGEIKHFAEMFKGQIRYSSIPPAFPGSDQPPGSSLSLVLSIFNSTENPTLPPSLEAQSNIHSASTALSDVNQAHRLLSGFDLKVSGISYGCYEFNKVWAQSRLQPVLDSIGLGIVGSPASSSTIGVLGLLPELGLERPLASASTSPRLSSPSVYPMFVRVLMSDAYTAVIYLNFIAFFGWTRCSVIYMQDSVWSEGVYQYFIKAAERRNITIANQADLRGIDDSLDPEHYAKQVQELIHCKARVAVLVVYVAQLEVLLRMLYDRGIRAGDVIFMAIEWMSVNRVQVSDQVDRGKFQELLKGTVTCVVHGFVGRQGAAIAKRLRDIGKDWIDCVYYDSALLFAHALHTMLVTGTDFEDPHLLSDAMRTSRFVGCSGLVTFEAGTNDRSQMSFELNNLQYFPANDTWRVQTVVVYNPSSIVLYRKVGEMQWFDGSSATPSDTQPVPPCPNYRDLSRFQPGELLFTGIIAFIAVLTGVVIWFIWSRWWQVRFTPLSTSQEISLEDYIMFAGMVIEFLQLLGTGPDITEITSLIATISEATSLNLSVLVYMEKGTFWLALDVVLVACASWLVALALTVLNLWKCVGFQWLESFSDRWLPFLGDICFLPIVSFLLNIYLCGRSYSDSFHSSVLNLDCFVTCWQSTHWTYISLVSLCLAIYIPLAVYTRPAWQRIQTTLHVKTHPLHLMIQTLFQLVLIVENKLIKREYSFIYAWIYIATVGTTALLFCLDRPHNYRRANLWHISGYIAAIWMAVVSGISQLLNNTGQNRGLLFGGWALLLVSTWLVQLFCFPSLLYRKTKDVRALFRFAFQPSPRMDIATIEFNKPNWYHEERKVAPSLEFTLNPKLEISLTKRTEEVSVTPTTRAKGQGDFEVDN